MEPKISVIIPVHNGEQYVGYAIESALNQTYPAWEIIAIDDGSTDDTPKVLDSFRGKITIRTIRHSGSPAVPRNVGIQWSTGNYMAFLDADDIWFKDKLKQQAEACQRFPEAGFICGDFICRRPDNGFRLARHFDERRFGKEFSYAELKFGRPLPNAFKLLLARNFVGCSSTVMLSKRVIDRIGGQNPGYPKAEDYEYWFRCAKHTKFLIMRSVLAYKRHHEENLSNDDIGMLQNHKRVLIEIFTEHRDYLKEHRLLDECFLRLARNNRHQAVYYSGVGDRRLALRLGLQSLLFSCSPENIVFWARAILRMLARRLRDTRAGRRERGEANPSEERVYVHDDSGARI